MLTINQLTGGYANQPVVHDLSFDIQPSEIVGMIGLNGAGKSTTIKHILGLLTPMNGSITLHGQSLQDHPESFRSQIAYIPETPQFYKELTLWEHIELTAAAYQLPHPEWTDRADWLLTLFHLHKKKHWFPETFSKGMQQKMLILMAFLVEPNYLIIDEPFIGLDPIAIQSLLDLLEEQKKKGSGILMSTHILDMAEKHCDRFLLIHEGRIQLQGSLDEIRKECHQPTATLEDLFMQTTRSDQ